MMEKLLHTEPTQRLSVEQMTSHSFMTPVQPIMPLPRARDGTNVGTFDREKQAIT